MTVTSDSDFELGDPDDEPNADLEADNTEDQVDELDADDEVEDLADGFDDDEAEDEGDDLDEDPDSDDDLEDGLQDDSDELDEDLLDDVAPVDAETVQPDRRDVAMPMAGPVDPADPLWSARQLASVTRRVLAVFVVMGMLGYGFGAGRGSGYVARTEFVYTLDESVPDSFLREDRRLLTQVVTFKSDAVLTPVAEQFDLTVDELRTRIDVETLDLSEVLRLDVRDRDPERAVAMSRAVLDHYLQVITDAAPAGDSTELDQRRAEVTAQLAAADATGRALLKARQLDVALEIRQASIQRQIDLKNEQINRIQGSLDDALVQTLTAARRTGLDEQFELSQQALLALENELVETGTQRAALVTDTTAEPALLREIERLESKLTTIDDELAERELGPLVASPIRELSEPLILSRSVHIFGLQGMAIGLLMAVPVSALIAYRTRRRQLWFD